MLPARHGLNLAMLVGTFVLGYLFMGAEGTAGLQPLLIMTGIACLLGIHLVAAIGGADMPVVILVGRLLLLVLCSTTIY